jgi:uncharacterized protein with ParB-like and HNH nuclease domain
MKASETKLSKIIEGTNQYLVPHYQRPYTWTQKEWKTLWSDLVELAEQPEDASAAPRQHFLGSIVTAPGRSVPEGVSKWVLIDGQQRLTTLLVLLAAIRDHARETGKERLGNQIQDLYLTNQYQEGIDFYKLLPTKGIDAAAGDRGDFLAIVDGKAPQAASSRIHNAYRFFRDRLAQANAPDADRLRQILIGNLLLVSIVLDRDDNPYLVFESLNAKGQQLSQADLIRNYFFMRIRLDLHDQIYAERWRPLEDRLGQENTTEFIRHYLMMDGGVIKLSELYFGLKTRLDDASEQEVLRVLDEFHETSEYYARLLRPEYESNSRIRVGIQHLNRLESTVTYPFLLNVYRAFSKGQLTDNDFVDILDTLENFLLRRYVCRTIRAELNKIFPVLFKNAQNYSSVPVGIREVLAGRNYPNDDDFRESLATSILYGTGERRERAKFILERIEESFAHKEKVPFPALSVEHVMPQTLTQWWQTHLGEEADDVHDSLLHTLGNLTLTGNNSELSNLSFPEKQRILADSHLELNREISARSQWTATEIRERATELSDRAITIWPDLDVHRNVKRRVTGKVTGSTPRRLMVYGREFDVSTWAAVLQVTMTEIAKLGDDVLATVTENLPRYVSREASRMRSPRQLDNGYFYEGHLNAEQIHRNCKHVAQLAGLASEEWYVEVSAQAVSTGT